MAGPTEIGRPLDWGAYDLLRLSEVEPGDIERAIDLWAEANREMGLGNLLSAESDADG